MSVCPSVRLKHLGSHWTNFHEISRLSIFRKSVEKNQVTLKSDKNNSSLYEDKFTFLIYIAQFFVERNMLQTNL